MTMESTVDFKRLLHVMNSEAWKKNLNRLNWLTVTTPSPPPPPPPPDNIAKQLRIKLMISLIRVLYSVQ